MKKIAVCVPTYNEADTIEQIVKKIDKGLLKYKSHYDTFIVNCDNNSKDGTGDIFKSIETVSKKFYISENDIGKGRNLFNFFKFCKVNKIDYAITLDSDVISMNSKWIDKFLNEMIYNNANYVVPSYRRSRFEGSTTNQFAFPLIYALTGKVIRQPIAGDFAFDKNFINLIVKQKYNEEIKKYGIDIFMTLNAVYGKLNIKSIELGKKIHKPSFGKMYNMFGEVLKAAVYTIETQKDVVIKNNKKFKEENINLIKSRKYKHKENANKMLEDSYKKLNKMNIESLKNLGYNGKKYITDKEWTNIINVLLNKLINHENINDEFIQNFVDLFVIRAVSFWNRAERMSAETSEEILLKVAKDLREIIIR